MSSVGLVILNAVWKVKMCQFKVSSYVKYDRLYWESRSGYHVRKFKYRRTNLKSIQRRIYQHDQVREIRGSVESPGSTKLHENPWCGVRLLVKLLTGTNKISNLITDLNTESWKMKRSIHFNRSLMASFSLHFINCFIFSLWFQPAEFFCGRISKKFWVKLLSSLRAVNWMQRTIFESTDSYFDWDMEFK